MDFSIRLENLIEERNVTQKQLSAELHIAATTLSGYINEYRQPDFNTLVRIAHYFDVSTDYLLGLCPEKKPVPSTLSPAEGALVHIFRSLSPDRQEMLVEQAKFYQSLNARSPKKNG